MIIGFLTNFNIERTEVPLRMHAKFLYEPIDENLVKLTEGGVFIIIVLKWSEDLYNDFWRH